MEQLVVPPPHTKVQLPLTQVCPLLQAVPQPPQLAGSLLVSAHLLPHFVSPPLHTRPQVPF